VTTLPQSIQYLKKHIIKLFIGKRWRTFVGIPYEQLDDFIQKIFECLDWEYREERIDPTLGEKVVFSSAKKRRYEVSSPDITVEFTSVTSDPLSNAFFSVIGSEESRNDISNSVVIIDISSINGKNRESVKLFIQRLVSLYDGEPWKISHPRFKFSPLLQYKTALLWQYWISED
jgi:hypothetical protein